MNTTQTTAGQTAAPVEPIKLEEDLSQLLDEHAARLAKRRKRANWVIFAFFGLMMATASGWYVSSEANQRTVADLILNIKSSGKDFKMITSVDKLASQYDAALEKIGTRSETISDASKAIGIDPSTVVEDGMETDKNQMMGEDGGPTVGERNRMLQQSLGKFVKKPGTQQPEKASTSVAKLNLQAAPAAAVQPKPATRPKPAVAPVVIPVEDDAPLIIR